MALTTEAAVRAVLKTKLDSAQLQAFIADSELWVTEELLGQGLTTARLEIITRYLACALARTRELGLKSVTFKDVSESYQADLYVTDYLKRAASFDSTGKVRLHFLGDGNGTRRARFRVGADFVAQQA